MTRSVYIAGGTGYLGVSLINLLVARGHSVRALARPGSESKLPSGCDVHTGDPLSASAIAPDGCDTFVHLVGTPHPAPWKGAQFRAIDAVALRASVDAAIHTGVRHFVYVSVAHPAPVMKAYIEVRSACEDYIRTSGLPATVLRPWYVLGPGHWWPVVLQPFYKLLELVPSTRAAALRLGLVSRRDMIAAMLEAIENPPDRMRIMDVPAIRKIAASHG